MAKKRKSGGGRGGRGRGGDVGRAVGEFKKLDARSQGVVLVVVVLVAIIAAVAYWREQNQREGAGEGGTVVRTEPSGGTKSPPSHPPTAPPVPPVVQGDVSVHLLLGNPSGARADVGDRWNYLMVKPYYALSYNEPAGTPNWVSWRVTREDVRGNSPRRQTFEEDRGLPAGYLRIVHRDYSGSGFDRGHLCPHADRDSTPEMTASTFVMTNIIPQAPNVNQGAWADLEDYCRDLVNREPARLYVIAGGSGKGGRGSAGFKETIGGGRVGVPEECWKVIVVVPESGGGNDLAKIGAGTRVIAVVMPNDNDAIKPGWAGYRVSVAEVERRTGYRFFDRLPGEVARVLKEKVDRVAIAAPVRGGAGGAR